MAAEDYYRILGLTRSAGDRDIKQSYRTLARRFHPDVNPGNKSAEERFKAINEAYEVLSDPEKRRKYDKYGDQWQDADHLAEAERRSRPQWRPTPNFGTGQPLHFENIDVENLFKDPLKPKVAADFTQRTTRAPGSRDIEYPLEVTFEEAYNGVLRNISLKSKIPCVNCGGTGRIQGAACPVCQGSSFVTQLKRLEIRIPAGVTNGSRVRVAGKGELGPAGTPPGDLYLVISLKPHNLFERKEDDLYVNLSVPLVTAMLGGDVEAPTLKGTKLGLRIPPETQNEQIFRLTGQGMPHLGNTSFGSLMVRIKVVLPSGLSPEEKALFNRLKELRPPDLK
jgi:molecular chaperone DnaJ